jgi:methionyl-tRNA synthetase
MGEETPRQIISGVAAHFPEPSALVGKKCAFAANLEPRVIRGLESNGMILAVSAEDGKFSLLEVSDDILPGCRIR